MSTRGLYPVGEGAGYAGGIISAAVDGLRAGQAIVEDLVGPSPDASRTPVVHDVAELMAAAT